MKRKEIIRFFPVNRILLIGPIIMLFLFTSTATASNYYITTADLNVRSGAGKNYNSLITLSKGDTVKLLRFAKNDWAEIKYKGVVGYSSIKYLKFIYSKPSNNNESIANTSSDKNETPVGIFALLSVIVISVVLKIIGKRKRKRTVAAVLAFLFGGLGFQKFYLGQDSKGILSIVFSWTLIPSIIGIIDFVKLLLMDEFTFDNEYNWVNTSYYIPTPRRNIHKPVKTMRRPIEDIMDILYEKEVKPKLKDKSIIDVNGETLDLSIEKKETIDTHQSTVPQWSHSYIYSYNEIEQANEDQKKFYFHFKSKVSNGEFVDIEGNTNYAFILYFDLLNEYEVHQDIKLLCRQFELLGKICPETKSYIARSIKDKSETKDDANSNNKSNEFERTVSEFDYGYALYNPDLYKLGTQYKDKLNLTPKEVEWLNKFYKPSNVFNSIEGCCIATIKLYLSALNSLENKLKGRKSDIESELEMIFNDVLASGELDFNSFYGEQDRQWAFENLQNSIFIAYYKAAENAVREKFEHKRKLSFERYSPYHKSAEIIDASIGNEFDSLLNELLTSIASPDAKTELDLNLQNVNRWKTTFSVLKDNFEEENIAEFVSGITELEERNQKNPNIENIFFEASKFIAKFEKVQSLKYYIKYIHYNLKSKKIDNKELTKTAQKSLFKTEQQLNDFRTIVAELKEGSDVQKTLGKVTEIYIPKRKKIELNKTEIEEVEQKHEGTVELLNGYLEEENTEQDNINEKEVEISEETNTDSLLKSTVSMGQVQQELVKRIVDNEFEITQDEVDKFATENGMFKNQLIDCINEACEEHLEGEALIEEEDENYIIEESFYKEIAK